jgi:phosphoribosylformimino-5-aminoimidazole carboxamide ribotide isomerase
VFIGFRTGQSGIRRLELQGCFCSDLALVFWVCGGVAGRDPKDDPKKGEGRQEEQQVHASQTPIGLDNAIAPPVDEHWPDRGSGWLKQNVQVRQRVTEANGLFASAVDGSWNQARGSGQDGRQHDEAGDACRREQLQQVSAARKSDRPGAKLHGWDDTLAAMIQVIPCVDIQRGRAVRLFKGDPNLETVYFDSPLLAAEHWVGKGADLVHLVDLDAATGTGENRALILEIASTLKVPVEVGGGVRSLEAAQILLSGGVRQVVIGTVAVTQPEVLTAILEQFGTESVVVSIDARDGLVAVKGWAETSQVHAVDLAANVWELGVRTLIYTDVTRDGTLEGLDEAPLLQIRAAWAGRLVAGGGVATVRDLELLEKAGIQGAIVGRALYEGTLEFPV